MVWAHLIALKSRTPLDERADIKAVFVLVLEDNAHTTHCRFDRAVACVSLLHDNLIRGQA